MCEVCGCSSSSSGASAQGVRERSGDARRVSIDVHAPLLAANDREARHLREHFLADGVLALNIMGSPGAGKTALLEAAARALPARRLAAVSGDLETALDAERLERAGIVSAAITTGSACHLEAAMVHHALHDRRLGAAVRACDVFFIENVGNLICPAIYDLGQAANVVVVSVTEGSDKPLKYPVMFRRAELVVLSKVDLLPHLPGVSLAAFRQHLARVAPSAELLPLSALTGEGVAQFAEWLEERVVGSRERTP